MVLFLFRSFRLYFFPVLVFTGSLFVRHDALAEHTIPCLASKGNATQLIVNGKPFLMIAGELHNSSASTIEYVSPIFPKLKSMNLNTVLATVAWEQFEPEEGHYDYTMIDALIEQARASDLKLVILWFASWKNGQSSYAPMWVKTNSKRFWRVKSKDGKNLETLSPACEETKFADARAFSALMQRIKVVDYDSTVIMVQPENEIGILQDMDFHPFSLSLFQEAVPKSLIDYLVANKELLTPNLKEAWELQECATSGNWTEVFGDSPASREFFMAWQMASYVDHVAQAGQRQHPLPMFVNAWIVQDANDLPGVYPNGGPVSRVMDIYKAAAPNIFTLCPDIYLPNFKDICDLYVRDDNPLLIPESTVDAGRAFYTFAEYNGMCYSPFGIDQRAVDDYAFQGAYATLNELGDIILSYQGTGQMKGLLRESDEQSRLLTMGNYEIKVFYEATDEPSYGLIIQTKPDEFLVAGVNLRVVFGSKEKGKTGYIGQVYEGRYEGAQWVTTRMLNGDETFHNEGLRVFGREAKAGTIVDSDLALGPQPVAGQQDFDLGNTQRIVKTPGIYKVITYMRD